jgi:hypothetical protein
MTLPILELRHLRLILHVIPELEYARFSWHHLQNADPSRTSWNFFMVGIKGNLLSDIKYDKRRTPDQRL